MKAENIKGALLEYLVRQLLKNCGFTNVRADNLFSFEQRGLFFINGKGAPDYPTSPQEASDPIKSVAHYAHRIPAHCGGYCDHWRGENQRNKPQDDGIKICKGVVFCGRGHWYWWLYWGLQFTAGICHRLRGGKWNYREQQAEQRQYFAEVGELSFTRCCWRDHSKPRFLNEVELLWLRLP